MTFKDHLLNLLNYFFPRTVRKLAFEHDIHENPAFSFSHPHRALPRRARERQADALMTRMDSNGNL